MQFKSVGAYTIYVRHNKVKCERAESGIYFSDDIGQTRALQRLALKTIISPWHIQNIKLYKL